MAGARDGTGFIGSDEVTINVASTAKLIDMKVYPEIDPLSLPLGASVPLVVYGYYDDGVTRDINSSGSGTFLYIFGDGVFISMLTNGTCVITVCPKFASPQLLLHLGTTLEYFSCREAFYHHYDLAHMICGHRLNQKMNMILIGANLQEFYLIPLFNIQTYVLQNLIDMIIKYYTSILRRQHKMVYQYRKIVTLVDVFAHSPILRRKRRGIQP